MSAMDITPLEPGSQDELRPFADMVPGAPADCDQGLIARVSGQPVGAAWLKDDGPAAAGFVGEGIPQVYVAVAEEHQGEGLGTKLLSGVLSLARMSGATAVSAAIAEANEAQELFGRLGFTDVGFGEGTYVLLADLSERR
ncbi:hypothetical protein CYJ40_08185 [Brevibacterium ravenspurgense]|uniref:N-acetyltransferase domain-containing protein n=2 Tax=Brevibacterium ravenspurgense TaxID=479117 RepID=A0A2I1IFX4_9MICO|nr:hypothetical protein CYJ40_08185 [Brevibacterium ravenspurgense]